MKAGNKVTDMLELEKYLNDNLKTNRSLSICVLKGKIVYTYPYKHGDIIIAEGETIIFEGTKFKITK